MLTSLLILLIIALIIGAIAGKKTFGESLKSGCGFIFVITIVLIAVVGILVFLFLDNL